MKNTFGPTPCVRTMLPAADPAILKELAVDACCAVQFIPCERWFSLCGQLLTRAAVEWISVDLHGFSALEKLSVYVQHFPSRSADLESVVVILSSGTSSYLRRVHLDFNNTQPVRYELPWLLTMVS